MRHVHMTSKPLLIALAMTLALMGCDRRSPSRTSDDAMPPASATRPSAPVAAEPAPATTSPPMSATPAPAKITPADEVFLTEVNRANEELVATAMLGLSQGSAKTQELASTISGEHVALRDQVRELAPEMAPSTDGAAPADLAQLQGAAFDRRFLDVLRSQSERSLRAFTDASDNRTLSEPVRLFASDAALSVNAHLAAIRQAQSAQGSE